MIRKALYRFRRSVRKKFKSASKKFKKLYSGTSPENSLTNINTTHIGDFNLLFTDLVRRGLKLNYILDVGAHSAQWIRSLMKFYPASTAYLIEPLSEMEENLKQFCIEYPGSKYFLNGAGSAEDVLYLTTECPLEGANFLVEKNPYLIDRKGQREIKIITVDSLISEDKIKMPDLVKLDVQGFEIEVLKGCELLFGKTEVFIIEVSLFEFVKGTPLFSEVINFMSAKGYEVYDIPGFLRRPFDNALGQVDVCFAKRDGILRASDLWTNPETIQ